MTKTVTLKMPMEEFERIPKGNVSQFFRDAAREKLEREGKSAWKPKTAYGKKLLALRQQYLKSGGKPLTLDQINREIKERRGGVG